MPMSPSDLRRLITREREQRQRANQVFPSGAGGKLASPTPMNNLALSKSQGGQVNLGSPPIGEIIRLHVHGHIGNSGEDILFHHIAYQNGFNAVEAPTAEVVLPYSAIYGIEGELEWTDGYTGGGTVTLVINGVDYMTLPGFTGAWTRFPIAMEFDGIKGMGLSIRVDHDDTAADHDLEGMLTIATKEPLKELVPDVVTLDATGVLGDDDDFLMIHPSSSFALDDIQWPNALEAATAGDLYVLVIAGANSYTRGAERHAIRSVTAENGWVKHSETLGTAIDLHDPPGFIGDVVFRTFAAVLTYTAVGGEIRSGATTRPASLLSSAAPDNTLAWPAWARTYLFYIPGGGSINDVQFAIDELPDTAPLVGSEFATTTMGPFESATEGSVNLYVADTTGSPARIGFDNESWPGGDSIFLGNDGTYRANDFDEALNGQLWFTSPTIQTFAELVQVLINVNRNG